MTPQEFYSQYLPYAEKVSNQTGLDPRLVLAQAALETGYGKSAPNMNFFGIKSHGRKGGRTLQTSEFENGQMVNQPASFRGYESPDQSFQDYARFLKSNPRYGGVLSAEGIENQISAMAKSGYATDPNYGAKLANIAGKFDPSSPPIIASDAMRVLGKQPKGLLASNTMNTTESEMIPEQKPKGLLGGLFSDPDKRARLAMALEGMTLNPNQGMMASLQGGIDQRGEDRKDAAAEAKQLARRNKTAEFLLANGREDLAGLVSQGMMSGSDAAKVLTTASKDTSTSAMRNYDEYQRILAEKGPEAAKQFLSTIKSGTTINTGDVGQGNFIYGSKAGLPAGYRLDKRTGEASVIPGGPAAIEAKEESEKAIKGETGQDRKDVSFYAAGERILAELGKEGALLPATGLMATAARGTPLIRLFAQRQENVAQDLAIMESQAQFETLADLKAASPTGASGLGQLTDAERKALGKLNANFESSQSEPAIRRTIKSAMILKSYFENGILDPETNKYRNATNEELDQMSQGILPTTAEGKPLFGDVQRYFGETQDKTIDADDGQYTIKEVGK
jgi:hypothetical protein